VAGIAHAAFGWVAVGVRINLDVVGASFAPSSDPFARLYSGVVWTSPDGRSWTRVSDGHEFDGARITDVVPYGTGALAFGLAGVCLPDACGGLPPNGGTIVWSSSDGSSWERLSGTGLSQGATVAVTATTDGLIAVGYVADDGSKPDDDEFSDPTDAAVWRSVDGRSWTQIQKLPTADLLFQVSSDGSRLIALGRKGSVTVVWTSADDGLTWTEGPTVDSDDGSLSLIRGSLITFASSTDDELPDGMVGSVDILDGKRTRDIPSAMHGFRPVSIQSLGASFVIFGWTGHRDSDDLLVDDKERAFSSPDGVTWSKATLPAAWDGQAPTAVAADGRDLVVILGQLDSLNGPPADLSETIWFGTAAAD
jgi:hypothetical protein